MHSTQFLGTNRGPLLQCALQLGSHSPQWQLKDVLASGSTLQPNRSRLQGEAPVWEEQEGGVEKVALTMQPPIPMVLMMSLSSQSTGIRPVALCLGAIPFVT